MNSVILHNHNIYAKYVVISKLEPSINVHYDCIFYHTHL